MNTGDSTIASIAHLLGQHFFLSFLGIYLDKFFLPFEGVWPLLRGVWPLLRGFGHFWGVFGHFSGRFGHFWGRFGHFRGGWGRVSACHVVDWNRAGKCILAIVANTFDRLKLKPSYRNLQRIPPTQISTSDSKTYLSCQESCVSRHDRA